MGVVLGHAQKKNSVVLQTGILNHFYDENPILMNTSYINQGQYTFRGFLSSIPIKSLSLRYSRHINVKSTIGVLFGRFKGQYPARYQPSENIKAPDIIRRTWYIFEIDYNRFLINKQKFDLLYGGGIIYRQGFESYHVFSYPAFIVNGSVGYESVFEHTGKKDLGVSLNMNLKYNIWKGLFLYSKIDAQLYLYDFAKKEYDEIVEKYPTREFPRTFPINHTLTIGLGYEFGRTVANN